VFRGIDERIYNSIREMTLPDQEEIEAMRLEAGPPTGTINDHKGRVRGDYSRLADGAFLAVMADE
jgi:hypothetical protein